MIQIRTYSSFAAQPSLSQLEMKEIRKERRHLVSYNVETIEKAQSTHKKKDIIYTQQSSIKRSGSALACSINWKNEN